MKSMNVLLAQGIGDAIWGLFKAQSVAEKYNIKEICVRIACSNPDNDTENRAISFIKRFSFVSECKMYPMPYHPEKCGSVLRRGPATHEDGSYRYIDSGFNRRLPDIDFVLIANGHLEKGIPLDDWLPEYKANWNMVKHHYMLTLAESEYANKFKKEVGDYAIFYTGPLSGNTTNGANKGGLWSPDDWIALGESIYKNLGIKIVLVGAEYDYSYYEECLKKHAKDKSYWINKIGKFKINKTFAVCRNSNFIISYPSGIGIVSHYLGVPCCFFTRPYGNSLNDSKFVSFSDEMSHAWAYPNSKKSGKFLAALYSKHTPNMVYDYIVQNNWHNGK